jgi:hypothetical protein
MLNVIECVGHPRDLGEDQGRACRIAVREYVNRGGLATKRGRLASLAAFTSGQVRGGGAGREIIRHYTHLSERIDGLARGAEVPVDSLLSLHTRTLGSPVDDPVYAPGLALSATGIEGAQGGTVVRSLARREHADSQWLVRRSQPEVGFASVEVTLPWLATAMAGVNTSGLCVSFVPDASADGDRAAASAPPAVLLVQECLQRFEDVLAAIDWCLGRPAHGQGAIVLADVNGELANVIVDGNRREVVRSIGEPLVAGAAPGLGDEVLRESTLDWKPLGRSGQAASAVRLCASRRLLELRSLTGAREHLVLEAEAGEA